MNKPTEIAWYRSKVDWWILVLLGLPPFSSVAILTTAIQTGDMVMVGIAGLIGLFVAALYVGVIFPLRYGLTSSALVIRNGMLRTEIPLKLIREVKPTRNPLSSPALSLDRLSVRFGEGRFKEVLISPANRDEFLQRLKECGVQT